MRLAARLHLTIFQVIQIIIVLFMLFHFHQDLRCNSFVRTMFAGAE